jgi:cytochrome c-type biogenesis protein CcmF
LAFGSSLGFPAIVAEEVVEDGFGAALMEKFASIAPLITTSLVAFNFGVIFQEFFRGTRARRKNSDEGVGVALWRLVQRSRRRYGGYIVHAGIGFMFLGFAGKAWDVEQEATLMPGESVELEHYRITYQGPRMEVDEEKRMIFTDLTVTDLDGNHVSDAAPAKYIFKKQQMPTSEVSILQSVRDDLYLTVGTVDPTSKRATFRIHVNPLVAWIWMGVFVLMIGCGISLWPEVRFRELGVWSYVRATAGVATGIAVSIMIASSPARASAMVDPAGEMVRAPTRSAAASPFRWDESRAASGLGALGAGVSLGAVALAIAGRRRRKSDV